MNPCPYAIITKTQVFWDATVCHQASSSRHFQEPPDPEDAHTTAHPTIYIFFLWKPSQCVN